MLVSRQKYGDEVKADIMLRGVVREMSASPTVNPLPTRFTSILPDSCPSYRTVPRQPVRLYIYFVAYERAIHPLVFPSSTHR